MAWVTVMAPIDFHGFSRNVPKRQQKFDEEIFLKDQVLTLLRTLSFEEFTGGIGPLIPRQKRPNDRLHVDDCLDALRMPLGPRKTQRRAPIMNDENDVLAKSHDVEPRIEIALMIDKPIVAVGRWARIAHTDIVRRQTPPKGQ